MEYFICSLEFERDRNLLCRKFLYKVYFRPEVGDMLVSPVGPHNKLQVGVVKEVFVLRENRLFRIRPAYSLDSLNGDGERLTVPLSSMKSVVCRFSFRRAAIPDCVNSRDLGGVLYDEKHLTAYGAFVRADIPRGEISDFNFSAVFYFGDERLSFGVDSYRFPVLYRPCEGGGEKRLASKIPFFRRFLKEEPTEEKESGGELTFTASDGEPKEKALAAYGQVPLMQGIFRALSVVDGTIMLCDKYGAYSVDLIALVLYLLVDTPPESIYKDYALSDYCLNEKYVEGDKFGENEYVPEFSEHEYISLIKDFKKKYKSAEEYLLSIGLTQGEVKILKEKMTVYKDF